MATCFVEMCASSDEDRSETNRRESDEEQYGRTPECFAHDEHSVDALQFVLSKLEIPENGFDHVISISGGTEKDVPFDDSLKSHLLIDLKKIFSKEQETLILTSGVERGVVHYVGEALNSLKWKESKTTKCLGLLTDDNKRLFESPISSDRLVLKSVKAKKLNQQHTHFMLVNSRTEDFWFQKGRLIRQQLQDYLAKAAANARAKDRSIVLLCVGGGIETITEIADCLRCKYPIPVVLFKGSGGATDFVDDITSDRISKKTLNEKLRDLCDKVKSYRGELCEEMKAYIRKDIATISRHSNSVKLRVYDYRNKIQGAAVHDFNDVVRLAVEKSNVFDETKGAKEKILKAINRARSKRTKRINFSVRSNRTRRTRDGNSTPLDRQTEEEKEKMLHPFRDQNISIIRRMKDECKATININNEIMKERRQMKGASENRKSNKEEQEDERLAKFINKYNEMLPNKDDSNQLSFRNIFLWAMETRRFDLAEFSFSKLQEDAIIASLVVSIGFRKVAETMPSQRHTENEKYMSFSREYERKATRLIEIAHEEDPGEVENILEHKHKHWRNFTCLKVAIRGKAKMFLSLDVCQKTLRKQWYGHIDTAHFEKTVMLAAPFYWLVACSDCIKVDISEDPSGKEEPDTGDANSSTGQQEDDASQSERQPQNNGSTDTKMTARDKVVRYFKKCKAFYSSPIANFTSHCLSYFLFLLLYACVLTLSHLDSTFPLADFVAHVWILAILIEIARAMFNLYGPEQNFSRRKHFIEWVKFTWNRLTMAAVVTSIVAFLCRWFTATRLLGRICYGINYALFAFRILRLYSATERFGPWVSMIKHMFFTAFQFTVIFMVFLFGYGVAIQALLGEHSGEGISFLAFRDIFYKPYFQVFGELFLDDMPGADEDADEDAPSTVTSIVYTCFLAIYLFIGNVLLLNLIIAIFSYNIQRVEEMSKEIWKFEKYILHEEFMKRATLPEPLSLIEYFYLIGKCIFNNYRQRNCCVNRNGTAVCPKDSTATTPSSNFVTHCLRRYVRDEEQRQLSSIEAKTDRLDRASGYIWEKNQEIVESARAIDSKSSAIDRKVVELAGATSEIKCGTSELKEQAVDIQRDTSRLLDDSKEAKELSVKLQKCQEYIARKMQLLEEHLQEWEGTSIKLPALAERSRSTEDSGIVASPGLSFTSDPPRVAENDIASVRISRSDENDFHGAGVNPNITSQLQDMETTLSHTHTHGTRRSENRDKVESPNRQRKERIRSGKTRKTRPNQKPKIVSSSSSSDTDSEITTDRRKEEKRSKRRQRQKRRAYDSIKITPDLPTRLKTSPIVASIHYYWGIGPSGNIEQIGRVKTGPQFSKLY